MKAKDLISILKVNPSADIFVTTLEKKETRFGYDYQESEVQPLDYTKSFKDKIIFCGGVEEFDNNN